MRCAGKTKGRRLDESRRYSPRLSLNFLVREASSPNVSLQGKSPDQLSQATSARRVGQFCLKRPEVDAAKRRTWHAVFNKRHALRRIATFTGTTWRVRTWYALNPSFRSFLCRFGVRQRSISPWMSTWHTCMIKVASPHPGHFSWSVELAPAVWDSEIDHFT